MLIILDTKIKKTILTFIFMVTNVFWRKSNRFIQQRPKIRGRLKFAGNLTYLWYFILMCKVAISSLSSTFSSWTCKVFVACSSTSLTSKRWQDFKLSCELYTHVLLVWCFSDRRESRCENNPCWNETFERWKGLKYAAMSVCPRILGLCCISFPCPNEETKENFITDVNCKTSVRNVWQPSCTVLLSQRGWHVHEISNRWVSC